MPPRTFGNILIEVVPSTLVMNKPHKHTHTHTHHVEHTHTHTHTHHVEHTHTHTMSSTHTHTHTHTHTPCQQNIPIDVVPSTLVMNKPVCAKVQALSLIANVCYVG